MVQEVLAQPLGQGDPVEEGMVLSSSSICAWRAPWTEGPGGPQSIASERVKKSRTRLKRLTSRAHDACQDLTHCYKHLILSSSHN